MAQLFVNVRISRFWFGQGFKKCDMANGIYLVLWPVALDTFAFASLCLYFQSLSLSLFYVQVQKQSFRNKILQLTDIADLKAR
jgi:hypothetical protein